MNDNKNLPLQAEIIALRATAQEARNLRADLQKKVTIIKETVTDIQPPQGPVRIMGQWW